MKLKIGKFSELSKKIEWTAHIHDDDPKVLSSITHVEYTLYPSNIGVIEATHSNKVKYEFATTKLGKMCEPMNEIN